MKAMVFAAGLGTRLKEKTATTPKCLVPLCDGTTMLDLVVENLKGAGVTDVIINLHYLGDRIKQHVVKKNSYDIRVVFSEEEELLGTGGGLKKASWFFDDGEPFFVHNSDVYSELHLESLHEAHKANPALATLAVIERETTRPLLFDKKYELIGWEGGSGNSAVIEGKTIEKRVGFSGIQVVDPSYFEYQAEFHGNFSTISVYMRAAESAKVVRGFDMTQSYWIDMGTPERLLELNNHLNQNI